MRVIAGKAKGHALIAPNGINTRPVTAKIKEALFSMWQMQMADSCFLDLFSGSGSIGIEAMSRGAKKVVFVEKDRKAINVIKKNLANCKFIDGYEVYQDDVFKRIEWLAKNGYVFDIIYLDPPFTVDEIFLPVMEFLSNAGIFDKDGCIAIRTRREKEMPEKIGVLRRFKLKHYGISSVHFFRRVEAQTSVLNNENSN
ncbi:MAG: 16S rRNA (guanine(966)-N(2))-methyltransferase RsmD [Eubacteriales bacterium]|nr:16S rRNA (guanine(966)-N(2))-methyltransferase RsmD [Eubacteriales bacterium]